MVPSVSEAAALMVMSAGAGNPAPVDGDVMLTVGGWLGVQASTSVILLKPPRALATFTRIFAVASGVKVNCLHTLLLPVTSPLGTDSQFEPSQYWTLNAVMPYE